MSGPARQDAQPSARLLAFEPPPHWPIKPLRYLFQPVGGATPSKDNAGYWDGDIPWVSPKDMKSDVIRDSEDHISEAALNGTRLALLPPSTVLIVVRGMILAHTIPVAITAVEATINQDMKGLFPKKGVTPEYLAHLLRAVSQALFSTVEESGHGTLCLRLDLWRNILVGVPPEDEQPSIVSFVEERSAYIDALIAKKQRMIDLLHEKRQALISEAVTRGLDPKMPLKDSGLAWLGWLPAHWHVVKLSLLAEVKNGCTPSRLRSDYWDNGTIPWLSSGKVNDYLIETPSELITETALAECPLTLIPKGSVVVGMIGQGKTRGTSARLGIEACINQNMAAVTPRPKLLLGEFLHYVLIHGYEELRESGRGGNQEAFNCELLASLRAPLPSVQEQSAICDHVRRETERTVSLKTTLRRQIEKLREYRQALITAAVTGKVAVQEGASNG